MDAAAKRYWADAFTCDIKLVRIRVNGGVTIGCPEQAQDRLSLANLQPPREPSVYDRRLGFAVQCFAA
jgi:hypothetical protein